MKPLKLMSQTASFTNYLMSGGSGVQPEVGMGVTILCWTDRNPATIVEVVKAKNGKIKAIVIQEDNYERTDQNGMSECQEWKYTPNPEAHKSTYELRRNGAWATKGSPARNGLLIGSREKYHDFSF